jgi:hypothetical protein
MLCLDIGSGREQPMVTKEAITLDTVLDMASQLSTSDQLRLVARLSTTLAEREVPSRPTSTYGLLAHLGPAPSAEDIDEVRREMLANFPRDTE